LRGIKGGWVNDRNCPTSKKRCDLLNSQWSEGKKKTKSLKNQKERGAQGKVFDDGSGSRECDEHQKAYGKLRSLYTQRGGGKASMKGKEKEAVGKKVQKIL